MVKNALKIILKGDQGVGKTTIAAQFAEKVSDISNFSSETEYSKNVTIEDTSRLVELLDVPDDFCMGDYFTEYGQGFLLVYSIEDYQTFENAKTMREDIMRIKKSKNVPIVLVGNKRDVADTSRAVDHDEAASVAASWPNCRFTEISARSYDEVEKTFQLLFDEIVNLEQADQKSSSEKKGCTCSIL